MSALSTIGLGVAIIGSGIRAIPGLSLAGTICVIVGGAIVILGAVM